MEDPGRNRNRVGGLWSVPTVGVILSNPRYAGRQVWNRRQALDPTSRSTVVGQCVVSKTLAHSALVCEADFVAAQQVRAARPTADGSRRGYLLAGLIRCGSCGRRMDAHWVHGRAAYRCRHGHNSAKSRPATAARNLYIREDELLSMLAVRITPTANGVARTAASPNEVVTYLLSNAQVVIYGLGGWHLADRD